jgi:opacity protein-like surface antigen
VERFLRRGKYLALSAAGLICVTATAAAADADSADGADKSWTIRPSLTVSGGYATNPDEEEEPLPSLTAEYAAKLEISHEIENVESELTLEATSLDYFDLEDNSRRAYEISGSTRIDLGGDSFLSFEAGRLDDGLSGSRIVEHEASAKWEKTGKKASITVSALFESTDNIDEDDNDEDYYKPQLETRLDFNAEGMISPFVTGRAGFVRYPRQEDADVNRDGKDYSLIAGAKFKPTDKLKLELGGRYNLRTLDEADIAKHDNVFVEANLSWSPTDTLELEAAIVRSLKEPTAGSAIVRDSTEYSAGLTWKPMEKLEFELSGSHERKEDIGAEEVELENSLEAGLSYAVNSHLTVFGAISHDWTQETDLTTGEVFKFDNTEVKVGMTTSFGG